MVNSEVDRMRSPGITVLLALLLLHCGDDRPARVGAPCSDPSRCETELCYAGFCLDPAADSDADGLDDGSEALLSTDPFDIDSDADGLDDGTEVGPATAVEATVTPDRLVRRHRLPGGDTVTETVELFDGENGFRVRYDGVPPGAFAVLPRVDMRFLWKVTQPGYEVRWEDGTLLVCRQDALAAEPDPAHPAWLAVAVRGADQRIDSQHPLAAPGQPFPVFRSRLQLHQPQEHVGRVGVQRGQLI